jgi:hypothetical protein
MSVEERFLAVEAAGQDGAYVRIDEHHPVDLFLGLEGGARAILVRCPSSPPDAPNLRAIRVDARPRSTGDGWALVLRLVQADLKPQFTRFVEDLVVVLQVPSMPPAPTVIARLVRWQRLFMPGANPVLGDRELRGLCAELDFLVDQAIPKAGVNAAIASWCGPFDAPKDFVFEQDEVEVKATHSQSRTVRISSLEQLSDEGRTLNLWLRPVELVVPKSPGSPTVSDLVASARAAASTNAVAARRLDEALLAAGFEDLPEYADIGVRFGRSRCYRVTDSFPRLQRPTLPAAISSCEYDLVVSALEPYRIDRWRT